MAEVTTPTPAPPATIPPPAVDAAPVAPVVESASPDAKTALTPPPEAGTKDGAKSAGAPTPNDAKPDEANATAGKPTEPVVEDIDVKLPKGVDADLTKFKELAKGTGLKAEQAQKFADLYVDFLGGAAAKAEAANKARQEGWKEAYKTDPEIGGAKLKESLDTASRAVARFASPELIRFMNATGLGDHPEWIRAFTRIGKAIAEDKSAMPVAGDQPPKRSREEVLSQLYDVHDQRPKKQGA